MNNELQTGLIAFGSNQGNPQQIFADAVDRLGSAAGVTIIRSSSEFWTRPIRGQSENSNEHREESSDYLNAVIKIQTRLSPQELHAETAGIELEFGRVREHRWGDRSIDLDLLLLGSQIVDSETLTLPHPRMTFRRFVLEPAAEIAAELMHPIANCSIGQLLEKINSPDKTMGITVSTNEKQESIVDLVIQTLSDSYPDWKFKKIFSQKKYFEAQQDLSILVTQEPVESDANELWQRTICFPGPSLRLNPNSDYEKTLTELRAAIQTIG